MSADHSTKSNEDPVVMLYLSIGEAERHFNTIQSHYRLLASTWTLATLAGIGFVLTSSSLSIGLDDNLLCSLIAVAGALSILILWLIDLRVYQRLLSHHYLEGLAMEQGDESLPRVRSQIRGEFQGKLSLTASLYYVALFAFLLLVACLFMGLSSAPANWKVGPLEGAAIIAGVGVIFVILILRSEWPAAREDVEVQTFDARVEHYRKQAEKRVSASKESPRAVT